MREYKHAYCSSQSYSASSSVGVQSDWAWYYAHARTRGVLRMRTAEGFALQNLSKLHCYIHWYAYILLQWHVKTFLHNMAKYNKQTINVTD